MASRSKKASPSLSFAADASESFELTPEQEAELLEAIAEIDRGEFVDGADLLRSLKRRA